MEHSSKHLQSLSTGILAKKTIKLLLNMPSFAAFLSINVFKRAAVFLKEITTDNTYTHVLASSEITNLV
jgi:hypothetical protein